MTGEKLHQFDLQLCAYVLGNVQGNISEAEFCKYVEEQFDSPMLAYLTTFGDDDEPEPLLLNDREFGELAITFWGGPMEFDKPWVPYEPLHRRHIDCVLEIKNELAAGYADEWARSAAKFTQQLEDERTRLGAGIEIVHDWVKEVRRLIRAMGASAWLPAPEGAFPTPSCREQSPNAPAALSTQQDKQSDGTLIAAIAETQALQREMRDLLLSQQTIKDFYTTAEVGAMLGKAEYTVREWCRNGRVHGQKQGSGRGKHQAWVISHEEMQRLQRDGLLPIAHP